MAAPPDRRNVLTTIKLRRGTAAQWATADPVLLAGEPGFETDSGRQKIGDGTHTWAQLEYFLPESALAATIAAALEARTVVNALDHGVVADGVTNDAPAWNTLVASLEGTDAVITWAGTSLLRGSIFWKKGVSLIGQGIGRSVLAKSNTHNTSAYFSAINYTPGYPSVASPFDDLVFANFEVDGSGVSFPAGAQWISDKAIFMQHLRRCIFHNLYLHDTVGTALGTDFMRDCIISSVIVERGGRGWDGVTGGHAGIGIGQGMTAEENVTISNCHTKDCGHWGIFVEKQTDPGVIAGKPRGNKIIGCSVTGTKGTGIGDYGCEDTIIMGNSVTGNGVSNLAAYREGIALMQGAEGAQVLNNIVTDNVGDGIGIKTTAGNGSTIAGNKVHRNGRCGIFVQAGTTFKSYKFRDNDLALNGFDGLAFSGAHNDLTIAGNHAYNNGQDPTAAGAGSNFGIAMGGTVDGALVARNRCYDNQSTKTQKAGISVASGTFTNYLMAGNHVTGNIDAKGIYVGVTSPQLLAIRWNDNLGAPNRSGGTATIANGATFATVSHGLIGWPTSVVLTPGGNEAVWVTNIDGTSFRINRAGTTGALTVYYAARFE
jgi:hypothetical protein